MTRTASCRCGQLQAACAGEPVRVSVCHCLECKRRSGSAFAAQARFPVERVTFTGNSTRWDYTGESGDSAEFHFCPVCGSQVWYRSAGLPDLIAIPIGAFADPAFPPPVYSVYEERKHGWVEITSDGTEHFA
ncbi:GFA family protein [Sphingomonas sp. KR3-1]|uniref:GFA family protein n=1 Tax=Sphingomonas sp. KR3-1 TaxID=3156611 RepID=UPI0032B3B708